MPLRFHWSLSSAGEKWKGAKARSEIAGVPNLPAHVAFCRQAESCGIESLLMAIGFHRPDPIVLSASLGVTTERIKFMVACRSGLISPTAFVQQVNTLSALTGGRVCINMVAGHTPEEQSGYGDLLDHDARYRRTDEFLTICRAFWEGEREVSFRGAYYQIEKGRLNTPFVSDERPGPEIFVGGASLAALELAARHASCLLTLPLAPAALQARVATVLNAGREVGLLVSLLARPTRSEALRAAREMIQHIGERPRQVHREFADRSESFAFTSTHALAGQRDAEWLTPYLWTGAVPYLGAPAIALVGSFEDIAQAILEYQRIGVTQFLFMGWPDLDEMDYFTRGVRPLVDARDREAQRRCTPA
jgi:alkanesulfonate monooxygenase